MYIKCNKRKRFSLPNNGGLKPSYVAAAVHSMSARMVEKKKIALSITDFFLDHENMFWQVHTLYAATSTIV